MIIKLHTVVIGKAILDLFEDLQRDDDHRRIKHHVERIFDLPVLVKQAQTHGRANSQKQPKNMKPTKQGRCGHLQLYYVKDKGEHKIPSFLSFFTILSRAIKTGKPLMPFLIILNNSLCHDIADFSCVGDNYML